MNPALLVATAHALDLLTFALAVQLLGISGESNGVMATAYLSAGMDGVIALKTAGTVALSCIALMRRWALLPAAGSGVLFASINLIAIGL